MGGTESIRGFIYQSIISVLRSFNDKDWDECKVEPNTETEKTDILFFKAGKIISAIQVKSSKNLFSQPQIKAWLEDLTGDVRSADKYELLLIGNTDPKGNKFIKEINDGQVQLRGCEASLSIQLNIYDMDMLGGAVEHQLNIFLQNEGYHLKQDHISILAKTLLQVFLEQSFVDKTLSREEFSTLLISWAKALVPKAMEHAEDSNIRVYAYDYREGVELETVTVAPYEPDLEDILQRLSFECKTLINRGKESTLPRRGSSKPERLPSKFGVSIPSFTVLMPKEDLDIPKKLISYITELVKSFFDEQLPEDFFSVGDLKCQTLGLSKETVGTTSEKERYELIYKLYFTLKEFEGLARYQVSVNGYLPLPLIVRNEGKKFDEDIEVTLEIPANIKILTRDSLEVGNDIDVLKHILKSDLKSVLAMERDDKVDAYPDVSPLVYMIPMQTRSSFPWSAEENEQQMLEKEFDDLKLVCLDFELLGKRNGIQSVRYTFSKINPNGMYAFPGKLLLKTDMEEFDISYAIKSRHSADRSKRRITIKQLRV